MVAVPVVVLLIMISFLVWKTCAAGSGLRSLQGTWRYDEYTEYGFDGKRRGCLYLDGITHFSYTYQVAGDTVKLNFTAYYVMSAEQAEQRLVHAPQGAQFHENGFFPFLWRTM